MSIKKCEHDAPNVTRYQLISGANASYSGATTFGNTNRDVMWQIAYYSSDTLDTTKQRVRQQLAISNQDANASTKLKKRQQIHIKDDI